MTRTPNISRKGRLLAGLANTAFLLCILLCSSGYISEIGQGQQKATQTEIKVSSGKTSKSTFHFGHAFLVAGTSVAAIDPTNVANRSLLQYGRSIATTFRSNVKQRLTIAKQFKILSVKYTPRSADALVTTFSGG